MKTPGSKLQAPSAVVNRLRQKHYGGQESTMADKEKLQTSSFNATGARRALSPIAARGQGCPRSSRFLVLLLLAGLICAVWCAPAGTITCIVEAQGKGGKDDPACGGKYASRQFKFAERVNYQEMHDFVVYIEGKVGTSLSAPKAPVQVVTTRPTSVLQKGAMFE